MAFEQGKILPTPETVPFRLSRDIVDGMGITGVEGVFRRLAQNYAQMLPLFVSIMLVWDLQALLYTYMENWTL